jgi:hypothetical protein
VNGHVERGITNNPDFPQDAKTLALSNVTELQSKYTNQLMPAAAQSIFEKAPIFETIFTSIQQAAIASSFIYRLKLNNNDPNSTYGEVAAIINNIVNPAKEVPYINLYNERLRANNFDRDSAYGETAAILNYLDSPARPSSLPDGVMRRNPDGTFELSSEFRASLARIMHRA